MTTNKKYPATSCCLMQCVMQ